MRITEDYPRDPCPRGSIRAFCASPGALEGPAEADLRLTRGDDRTRRFERQIDGLARRYGDPGFRDAREVAGDRALVEHVRDVGEDADSIPPAERELLLEPEIEPDLPWQTPAA